MKRLLTYLILSIAAAGCGEGETQYISNEQKQSIEKRIIKLKATKDSISEYKYRRDSLYGYTLILKDFRTNKDITNYISIIKLEDKPASNVNIEFNPNKITLTGLSIVQKGRIIEPNGISSIIEDSVLLSSLNNLFLTKYNIRYCCCLEKDYSIVMEGTNGKEIKMFVDTLTNSGEMIIYPMNYNFCLKTKIEMIDYLLSK